MTRTTRALSWLTLALEEAGALVLENETGRLFVRCPFTRWHADVPIKLAEIVLGYDGVSPDVLRCEICGERSTGDVVRILHPSAIRRASDRHSLEVERTRGSSRVPDEGASE